MILINKETKLMSRALIMETLKKLNNKKINYFSEEEINEEINLMCELELSDETRIERIKWMRSYKIKFKFDSIRDYGYACGTFKSYNRGGEGEVKDERDFTLEYDDEGLFHISGVYTSFDWYGEVKTDGTIKKQ